MVRILELEKYAKENNIPIMMKDGIEFLLDFIIKNNVKNILEIGSAIGYSAIRMASLDKDIKVTTIERDVERYNEAIKNINSYNLEDQITIINDDAFNVNLDEKYDLIFIDAAKSQYIKFFEKFKLNLKDDGYIVSDNLNFHGLVGSNPENLSKNVRGLVRKLNNYVEFLKNNDEFETKFYDLGDGVSVSQRKEVFMKKRGFTLIELLGVIVILAAIALIAFPPILNQIQKSQASIDDATKKLITSAAALYVDENSDNFIERDGNVYCTSFDDLISSGYLTEGMLKGNVDIKEKMIVKVSYADDFSYDVVPTNQCEEIIENFTDASCFATTENSDNTLTISNYSCSDIEIIIPSAINGKQVSAIADNAFYSKNLTSVTIPEGIKTIGNSSFSYNKLTSIAIPDTVITLGDRLFEGNDLRTATIGRNVESIGYMAFFKDDWETGKSNINLATIYNNTGRSFDWGMIINSITPNYNLVSGTVPAEYCQYDLCVDTQIIAE